jgi:hypothetical protein
VAAAKNAKNALEDVVLVAGTKQNLSNLYCLDIYAFMSIIKKFCNQTELSLFLSKGKRSKSLNLA